MRTGTVTTVCDLCRAPEEPGRGMCYLALRLLDTAVPFGEPGANWLLNRSLEVCPKCLARIKASLEYCADQGFPLPPEKKGKK